MYNYKFYIGSYEESEEKNFYSEEKLTEDQLLNKVIAATLDYLNSDKDAIRFRFANVFDIFYRMGDAYFIKQNLNPIKTEAQVSFFGWNTLGDQTFDDSGKLETHIWENETGEEDKKFINAIKDKVFELMNKLPKEEEEITQ